MLTKDALAAPSGLPILNKDSKQFCFSFGDVHLRGRIPLERDHVELAPDKKLASVTDRGLNYTTNQDDVRVRITSVDSARASILVVCDGVSGGQIPEQASAVGVNTVSDFLFKHLILGGDPKQAMRQAILDADAAIRQLEYTKDDPNLLPPGTTIVAAVAIRRRLVVGWVGDSRCYLIDPDGARLLTKDHSWVNEVLDAGIMTEEQAMKRREAHQISRCLGPLYGNQTTDIPEPSIVMERLPDSGRVLLCSDGLWNYFPNHERLNMLVSCGMNSPAALLQARTLVDFATSQGGRDNITAAILTI